MNLMELHLIAACWHLCRHYESAINQTIKFTFSPYSVLATRIVERHTLSTSAFIDRSNVNQPLHDPLLAFRLSCPSQRALRRASAHTETHRWFIMPYPLRFSADPLTAKLIFFLTSRVTEHKFVYYLFTLT